MSDVRLTWLHLNLCWFFVQAWKFSLVLLFVCKLPICVFTMTFDFSILAAGLQETGISMFLGSAVIGAVIGWGFKKFNLIYLAMHQVCLYPITVIVIFFLIVLCFMLFRLIQHQNEMGVKLLPKSWKLITSNTCLHWLEDIFHLF